MDDLERTKERKRQIDRQIDTRDRKIDELDIDRQIDEIE